MRYSFSTVETSIAAYIHTHAHVQIIYIYMCEVYIYMYSVYARAYSCRGFENSSLLFWAFIKNLRPTACQSPVKAS